MVVSGFACRSCNFLLLLCDDEVGGRIVEGFRMGTHAIPIRCPECGLEYSYSFFDLNVFVRGVHRPAASYAGKSAGL